MLDCISGYKLFTKLDILMQYYTFELDEPNQELCVIVMPFGKYKYKHLPMRLKCAPDFAQQVMEEVLCNVEDNGIYLDNIGAFSFPWEHHMLLFNKIGWKPTVSLSTHSNANEPFRKLIGLAIGSHPLV